MTRRESVFDNGHREVARAAERRARPGARRSRAGHFGLHPRGAGPCRGGQPGGRTLRSCASTSRPLECDVAGGPVAIDCPARRERAICNPCERLNSIRQVVTGGVDRRGASDLVGRCLAGGSRTSHLIRSVLPERADHQHARRDCVHARPRIASQRGPAVASAPRASLRPPESANSGRSSTQCRRLMLIPSLGSPRGARPTVERLRMLATRLEWLPLDAAADLRRLGDGRERQPDQLRRSLRAALRRHR
jgi:hypothetical protein